MTFFFIIPAIYFLWTTARIIRALRRTHASDVHTISYFSALAFVLTMLAAFWAVSQGAMGEHGGFAPSRTGQVLEFMLDSMFDLRTDALIVTGILSVLILPQLLAYVLCMPFGCSSRPWLVGPGVAFMLWSAVKFFAVLSGVTAALSLMDAVYWSHDAKTALIGMDIVSFLTCIAFLILLMYRCAELIVARMARYCPERLLIQLRRMDAWASRCRTPTQIKVSVTLGEQPPITS